MNDAAKETAINSHTEFLNSMPIECENEDGELIDEYFDHSEDEVIEVCDIGLIGSGVNEFGRHDDNLQSSVKAYEKQQIYQVLSRCKWNKAEAAKALGVGLSSLYRKIDELEIEVQNNNQ